MKKSLLLLSVIGLIFTSCIQDKNEYILGEYFLPEGEIDSTCLLLQMEDYMAYAIPEQCMNTIYQETFEDDTSWFTGSQSDCIFDIDNGKYIGECEGTNFYTYCTGCELLNAENFQIEIDIRLEYSGNTCSVNWGGFDSYRNVYRFGINSDKQYVIAQNEDGQSLDPIVPLTPFAKINPTGSNKLTIRKVGNSTFFFINEHYCNAVNDLQLYGSEITLRVGDGSKCSFDNLIISEFAQQ